MNGELCPIGAPPDPSSGIPCVAIARSVARNLTGMGTGFDRIDRAGVLVGRKKPIAGGVLLLIEGMMDLFTLTTDLRCPAAVANMGDRIKHAISGWYPELELVGWYHTHPGFGVFASDADRDAHSALASLACEVLLIVDPIKNQASFFYLRNGEMLQCPGYFIFDASQGPGDASDVQENGLCDPTAEMTVRTFTGPDPANCSVVGQGIPPSRSGSGSSDAEGEARYGLPKQTRPSRPIGCSNQPSITRGVIALLAAILIGLLLITIELRSARGAVSRLVSDYVQLSSQLSEVGTTLQQLGNSTLDHSPSAMQPAAKTDTDTGALGSGVIYVHVLPGDSISGIARRIYGQSSWESVRAILELNELDDPRQLRAGAVLKLSLSQPRASKTEMEEVSANER